MTISIVQSASSGDLSGSCTLGAGLTLNNWLVMIAADYNGGGSNVAPPSSPTVGGSSISPTSLLSDTSPASQSVAYIIWLIQVTSAMAGQTVLAASGGAGMIKVYGIEAHAGGALSLDKTAKGGGSSASASAGPTAGAAVGGELAVFALPTFGVNPSVSGGGWSIVGGQNYMSAGYQVLGAAGSTASVSATLSGSNAWLAGIATIQEAGGGGSSHTATASLTVTPSFSAGRARGKYRAGSLLAVPSFSASRRAAHVRAGSLLVVPAFRAVPSGGAARQGSWWGLVSVLRHSRQEFDSFISRPPVACPRCGEPLINAPTTASGSGKQLFCKFDGWSYPRDWHAPTRYGPGADL